MFSCCFLPLASFDVPVSHLQRSAGDNKIAKIHLYRWKEPLKSGKLPSFKVTTFFLHTLREKRILAMLNVPE